MADRRPTPKRGKSFAADAAVLVVATLFALPAVAASTIHDPDDEADKATLDVPVHALVSKTQNHDAIKPVRLLAPGAAAAIRKAFHTDSLIDFAKREDDRPESQPALETRLPGVSDDDQSLYKKRMYRRDI